MTALTATPAPTGTVRPAGAWSTLSDAIATEVPPIAGRTGLAVACAPGAGAGAPACYFPGLGLIEVDGTLLGVDPATANPASPPDRERYPVLWGATIHECAHARHSQWPVPARGVTGWGDAARMLEESRIEAAQTTRRPGDRRWLRATATRLILDDFKAAGAPPASAQEAGAAAALLLARAGAGILDPTETAGVTAAVEAVVGADKLSRLEATWRAVHATPDTDVRSMVRLARRWCRILGIDPDSAPPAPVIIIVSVSAIGEAIRAAAKAIAATVADEFTPDLPALPSRAGERAAEQAARDHARRAASRVFTPGTPRAARPAAGTRDPRPAEQAAARRLTRALRAASAGQRASTTVTSATPPGRLRMRAVMAGEAQRAAGALPTAEPFTRTRHRRVPAPPLRVGIACDISGSMSACTGPVASAAWILARATAAIPAATTATVLYGEHVHPLTWPGRAPAQVTEFTAPDATERFTEAIDALDGALGLSRPGAARLLVIVSDGHYKGTEPATGQQRITRLAATGCGILWLAPTTWSTPMTGAHTTVIDDPAAAIEAIAQAATRALTT